MANVSPLSTLKGSEVTMGEARSRVSQAPFCLVGFQAAPKMLGMVVGGELQVWMEEELDKPRARRWAGKAVRLQQEVEGRGQGIETRKRKQAQLLPWPPPGSRCSCHSACSALSCPDSARVYSRVIECSRSAAPFRGLPGALRILWLSV